MLCKNPLLRAAVPLAAVLALSACGGDDDYYSCGDCGVGPVPVQFNGTLSGMASGTSIELGDTTGITTALSTDGSFSYQTSVYTTAPLIGVLVQPAGQNCAVVNGTPDANNNISVSVSCVALSGSPPPALVLYAGSLNPGAGDDTGLNASFNGPSALATDSAGNVYVCDSGNNTIRVIAPGGTVTTLAGAAGVIGASDGTGASASFNNPQALALDGSGNVYVADSGNNTIRKIAPGGVVTTLAGTAGVVGSGDGTGAAASFNLPMGIAVNAAGTVYVSDYNNGTVRAITPAGVVTTLAGTAGMVGGANGTGAAASFDGVQGMALDTAGNIYVADTYNDTIRLITPAGVVSTFAGTPEIAGAANGTTSAATFNLPTDVAFDALGNLYVADNGNDLVRQITSGTVSTIVGTPGQNVFSAGSLPGSLQNPTSLAVSGTTLYLTTINAVADVANVP